MVRKLTKEPFTDCNFHREIRKHIDEHEIFISFINDDDAVLFYKWWNEKGAVLFNNYKMKTSGQTS